MSETPRSSLWDQLVAQTVKALSSNRPENFQLLDEVIAKVKIPSDKARLAILAVAFERWLQPQFPSATHQ